MKFADSLNFNDIKFEAPVRIDLVSANKHYYTQSLKYQGKDLVIPTEWFYSEGISTLYDQNEILTPISKDILSILRKIEDIAISNGLQLPPGFEDVSNTGHGLLKPIPEKSNLYLKLARNAVMYDKHCKPIKKADLQMGNYRVAIHVKGLYIGKHSNDKIVSLQLRIIQVQNEANIPQCIFTSLPIPMTQNDIETKVTSLATKENTGTGKKSRKHKLQRQNALTEPQSEQVMETLSPEFFNEILSNN